MTLAIYHVITDRWGPYVDIRACLQSRERRTNRTHVITPEQFDELPHEIIENTDAFFIHWQPERARAGLRLSSAKHAAVYSEAYDDDASKLLPEHLAHLKAFYARREEFDCVFAHTPKMAARLGNRPGTPGFVLPVGWDADAMGAPRWDAPKVPISFHGSMVGRRDSALATWLGAGAQNNQVAIWSGLYGRQLLGALDQSALSFYKAHSDVMSFSTWRLWQCASTACVLAADTVSTDSWPFFAGEHYVKLQYTDGIAQSQELYDLAQQTDRLRALVMQAHELAREFTVDRIEKAYIVPAFEQLKAR